MLYLFLSVFFFFKQKTAYEMRISDWSSDVCSSDLTQPERHAPLDLVDDLRVGQVKIRLVLVEQMAVVLAGFLVPGPDAVLDRRENRIHEIVGLVGPYVVVTVGRLAVTAHPQIGRAHV